MDRLWIVEPKPNVWKSSPSTGKDTDMRRSFHPVFFDEDVQPTPENPSQPADVRRRSSSIPREHVPALEEEVNGTDFYNLHHPSNKNSEVITYQPSSQFTREVVNYQLVGGARTHETTAVYGWFKRRFRVQQRIFIIGNQHQWNKRPKNQLKLSESALVSSQNTRLSDSDSGG